MIFSKHHLIRTALRQAVVLWAAWQLAAPAFAQTIPVVVLATGETDTGLAHIEALDDAGNVRVTQPEIPGAETAVVRGIMPDSYPGAFAVMFPEGPSLCFDPVRGGINYIWEGTFIDFCPMWTGKVGQPAKIRGDRFYAEETEKPLRRGEPDTVPEFQFQGYRIQNGYPIFRYRIDDCNVREELRPFSDGRGIIRRFQTDAPGETFWLLTGVQEGSVCSAEGGEWRDGRLRVRADETGAFTITIRKVEGTE